MSDSRGMRSGTSYHREEAVGVQVVDSALKVYKVLGPGLLESVYQACCV
jgi:hypothetical protein